ncbi:hypothetical protein DH2020_023222 [Rehmannia glutinosa]|uniref:Tf2-1-like SH3-like domain-containing protein n=1 Tax=Rehmannia glutinosa TaxID=99300 RepID=A0ABR0W973_REHGL
MLRACVLDFKGNWHSHLSLAEFAYNNSYQATIGMAPYEALYGRKCKSLVHWEIDDQWTPKEVDLIQEAVDKFRLMKKRIRTEQSHQKCYANNRRKDLEFEMGDEVFLRLSRIGTLAYRLELPHALGGLHDVFHVSRMKKYNPDPKHVITEEIPDIMEDLTYTERPLRIIDSQIRELRNKKISLVKVVWQKHKIPEEATWGTEEKMRNSYPELF